MTTDLKLIPGTFVDTSVKVEGVSERGRDFLQEIVGSNFAGVHGVTLPKTRGFDLMRFAEQKGLTYEVVS
jgi:hypothetical protein